MAKKDETSVDEATETTEETVNAPVVPTFKFSLLTNDFGREDLNELRDKINEIIRSL